MADPLGDLLVRVAEAELGDAELAPPSTGPADVEVLVPHTSRWGRVALGTALAATAAALVAVVLVALPRDPSTEIRSATPTGEGTVDRRRAPDARLRLAVDATLASTSFQVRSQSRSLDDGLLPTTPPTIAGLPMPFGDPRHPIGSSVLARSGDLWAISWSVAGVDSPVGLVWDGSTGLTYWREPDGRWRRALATEPPAGEGGLRGLMASRCVEAAGTSALLVTETDGPCRATAEAGSPVRWRVDLRPDGRIGSITSVDDGAPGGWELTYRFDYDAAMPVRLPGPGAASDAPPPVGFGIDAATGLVSPMYTNG